jgi:hypothetical protein
LFEHFAPFFREYEHIKESVKVLLSLSQKHIASGIAALLAG